MGHRVLENCKRHGIAGKNFLCYGPWDSRSRVWIVRLWSVETGPVLHPAFSVKGDQLAGGAALSTTCITHLCAYRQEMRAEPGRSAQAFPVRPAHHHWTLLLLPFTNLKNLYSPHSQSQGQWSFNFPFILGEQNFMKNRFSLYNKQLSNEETERYFSELGFLFLFS